MEIDEIEIIELELKYCERCGGLWLRVCGSERVYCGACAEKVSYPNSGGKLTGCNSTAMDASAPGELALLCGEGGNA
jgi:hypothetical protein